MSTFYFKLDNFDNPYYDDRGTTSTITINSQAKVCASELGLGRDFQTSGALGMLRLNEDISGDDYSFIIAVNKLLCPSTISTYRVAISKDNNYCPLCFDSNGYIGMLYNNSFQKATSVAFPSGKKIQDVAGGVLVQVGCIKDVGSTHYYLNGVYIGTVLSTISFDNTVLNDIYLGSMPSRDGRLGILDEVVLLNEVVSAPDIIKMYASFSRYIEYEDDLGISFYYSNDGTPSNSIGGPITSSTVYPYSDLNAVIPEIIRMDNFQGNAVYRCIYLKNTTTLTIFEPRLTIISDIEDTTPTVSFESKNTIAPLCADKYDSSEVLIFKDWYVPDELKLCEYLNPNEFMAIWIKEYVNNLYIPSSLLTESAAAGNNYIYVVYLESYRFTVNEFVLVHHQIDNLTYFYDIVQIKEIDKSLDKLTFSTNLSNTFPIGSTVSKLSRSLFMVKYGA